MLTHEERCEEKPEDVSGRPDDRAWCEAHEAYEYDVAERVLPGRPILCEVAFLDAAAFWGEALEQVGA